MKRRDTVLDNNGLEFEMNREAAFKSGQLIASIAARYNNMTKKIVTDHILYPLQFLTLYGGNPHDIFTKQLIGFQVPYLISIEYKPFVYDGYFDMLNKYKNAHMLLNENL